MSYKKTFNNHESLMYVRWILPHNICMNILKGLPCKPHSIRLWSMDNVNANVILIQYLKSLFAKRVPRMITDSLWHQYDSHRHIPTLSWDWVHHKGTLQRDKVELIYKTCVATWLWWPPDDIKFASKWSKYTGTWNNRNSLTTRWFVISALYKRVPKFILSMLSHSKHNLFWNKIHTSSYVSRFSTYE